MIKINKFYPEKHFFDMSIEELKIFVKDQKRKFKRYEIKRKSIKWTRRKRKIKRKKITRKNIV